MITSRSEEKARRRGQQHHCTRMVRSAAGLFFAGLAAQFVAPLQAAEWSTVPLGKWTESRSLEGTQAPAGSPGTWSEKEGVLTATGVGSQWSTRLLPKDQAANQKVTLKFNVQQSAGQPFALPGNCVRWSYYWGENSPGWDVGVVLRFKDPLNFYRVQLSATRGQLALWDSTGGFLQLVPCAVKVNEPHTLQVTARGAHFQVSLDDKPVLDYWDRTLPHLAGRTGLAVCQSTTVVASFSAEKIKRDAAPMPPHQPDFRFDVTTNPAMPALYDGNEPISLFFATPSANLPMHDTVKLKPGWRPSFYSDLGFNLNRGDAYWTPLVGKFPEALTITGGGKTISYSLAVEKAGLLHADIACTVSFDTARGVYRYEYGARMKLLGDKPLANLGEFEWLDPLCNNNRNPGPEVLHRWNPTGHRWVVYQAPGNVWQRFPMVDYLDAYNNPEVAPGKFTDFLYPDPGACPVFENELGWDPAPKRYFKVGMCTWGYDYHHSEVGAGINLPAGTERSLKMTFTGLPPAEADKLFAQSKLSEAMAKDTTKLIPFDPSGTTFAKTTTWQDPNSTMIWNGGVLDQTVGHKDKVSLRIDGPDKAAVQMYDYIYEVFAKRWRVSGWYKTKGLRGRGLELSVKYAYAKEPLQKFYLGGLGDKDWTPFCFITTVPLARDCTLLTIEADGPGKVWIDEVAFSALQDGDTPSVTTFAEPAGIAAQKDLLIDLAMREASPKAVYDESRNGHPLYLTKVTWAEEAGKGFLTFNGIDSGARIPLQAVLEPRDPPPGTTGTEIYKPIFALDAFTYEFWVRPRPPANKNNGWMTVLHYRFNPWAYFDEVAVKPGECRFVWQNNIFQGKEIKLTQNVPYGQWSHFAITHGGGKVTLYVNGQKANETDYDVKAPGFAFFHYKREFDVGSFLGIDRRLTGDLGPLRLYPKALTAGDVATRFNSASKSN